MAADGHLVPVDRVVSEVVVVRNVFPDVALLLALFLHIDIGEVGKFVVVASFGGRFLDELHLGSARRASRRSHVIPQIVADGVVMWPGGLLVFVVPIFIVIVHGWLLFRPHSALFVSLQCLSGLCLR